MEMGAGVMVLAACQSAPATQEVEGRFIAYLQGQEQQDVAQVVWEMNSIDDSREAVLEESRSIEESIAESIIESSIEESIYESMSVEYSIAESVSIEESIAESASIAESMSIEESIEESMSIAESESIEESMSIEESVAESMSIEASIAESVSIENSIAESARVEASIAESMSAAAAQAASRAQLESQLEQAASKEQALGQTQSSGVVSGTVLSAGNVVNATMNDVPMIRKLFANTVVIGDSRAKGSVDSGVLSENEVTYYGGASVGTLYDTTARGAAMMRSKALFIVGLNDLGFYHGDAEAFKADLINLIASYRAINPNSKIYLQEILPVQEYGRYAWPMMDYRPLYNVAIQEICAEYGYTYVSTNAYALPQYVNSNDGAHFSQAFYLLWAQTVANQMGLWEDLK
jgi:hypothetical protein